MLLITGGVGIFQLSAYCSLLRLLFAENIDLARSVVLRKKSVRSPLLPAIGIGSEMVGLYVTEEPEEFRELGLRWRPLQMTHASIRNAPKNMPGNRPARKTPIGNLLHCGCVWAADAFAVDELGVEVEMDDVLVPAVEEVLVAVADEVVVDELDAFPPD
jgi:hypothetical protein